MNCAAYNIYLENESKGTRPKTRKKRVQDCGFNWLNSTNPLPTNDLPEKITILGEDGVGDEIFYAQFLPALAHKCKEVIWVCNWKDKHQNNDNSKLIPLFQNSFHALENVKLWHFRAAEDLPSHQVLFSKELMRYFGRSENQWKDSVKVKYPYLSASPQLTSELAKRYKNGTKKVVGLAWNSEGGKPGKSLPFKEHPDWQYVFDQKDKYSFVSLQYGDVSDSINYVRYKYGVEVYHDAEIDHFNNLESAAAQVAACDIIISISTTTAHLAGAMFKSTLLLLPKEPIVHWLFDCAYPTVQRFKNLNLHSASETLRNLGCEPQNSPNCHGK